jgi:hypothetical protein
MVSTSAMSWPGRSSRLTCSAALGAGRVDVDRTQIAEEIEGVGLSELHLVRIF